MKKAYSLYLMTTENVGDFHVSPADYFDFPMAVNKLCVHNSFDVDLGDSFIIFGGGGLVHSGAVGQPMEYLERICKFSPHMVTWGMGHNIHGSDKIEYPDYFIDAFVSHGVRDYKQKVLPWVPCVSCMDIAFSRKYKVKRKYSVTGHGLDRFPSLSNLAKMEHMGADFEECIEFLGTGEYVITNAYHGAYWGAILGKKVIVFDPMSSKFYSMFDNIILATPDTWKDRVDEAEPDKTLLRKCRKRSQQYFNTVSKLMEDYLNV